MCCLSGEADAVGSADSLARLMKKVDAISSEARITHAVFYFYDLLEGNEKDRPNKIQSQSRITEMAKHRLSTSSLQALLWRKVLAASTSTLSTSRK